MSNKEAKLLELTNKLERLLREIECLQLGISPQIKHDINNKYQSVYGIIERIKDLKEVSGGKVSG